MREKRDSCIQPPTRISSISDGLGGLVGIAEVAPGTVFGHGVGSHGGRVRSNVLFKLL